jgi:hypothetical protein
LRLAWTRFERAAAEPAARSRPWSRLLAVVALAGTGVGLLRLFTGLWAVGICRRRGRVVDDPELAGVLHELRGLMHCRPHVEIREAADLTTAATAGWLRPALLLPHDWRSWSNSERRAVLAHELAHIIRGDYAVGLLARLAVALHYYHPVVRWIAGRLQLQQEQAADALGARFAGGRASYLVALSSLALKQDGQSPCWPAREFLAAQGTLIRRILMLRRQNGTGMMDRPLSRFWRLATTFSLLGLALGVAMLHGPALGGEGEKPATATPNIVTTSNRATGPLLLPPYVPDGATGLVVFRPAATFRRMSPDLVVPLLNSFLDIDVSEFMKQYQVITSRPGALRLGVEDIEWVTGGIRFGRSKSNEGKVLHNFMLGSPTVRTAAPFDWLAFLRQWHFDFAEARHGGRIYYKMTGPLKETLGPNPCVCLLDDRTVIFDEEPAIRAFLGREPSQPPAFTRGPGWERASRGLLAVAIHNEGGAFAKQYDLGRPDDAVLLSLLKDVNYWTLCVADADSIALHAAAACRNGEVSKAITAVIETLLKLPLAEIEQPDHQALATASELDEHGYRMIKALLANIRVEHAERSVDLFTDGFGTLAELASLIKAEASDAKSRGAGGGAGRNTPSGRKDRHDK